MLLVFSVLLLNITFRSRILFVPLPRYRLNDIEVFPEAHSEGVSCR